ncbi:ferritin-like domain-containing protein [Nocardioides sp. YIM 152315]|uniref:ferritin-like domain-containing protein n=1 Tax=Nocardioides sp. YIM 152315 TaxID=3031760 RepID=UPI0023D9D8DC|nr:ferritin-like domain-containing protein [Nocardioides sp. YIM 152315]MDF1605742.1 ferritin-like domain-containing protein [Nocardioides sp. YIM 152315]
MFGKTVVRDMINRSAESETDRRLFLKSAGVAGLGAVGGAALTGVGVSPAMAAGPSDGTILNFALNLEYLEAEFYSHAALGHGLDGKLTSGRGRHGGVVGGRKVHFASRKIEHMAKEIAHDEVDHVKFLRKALGGAKVARPQIDLKHSFTAAAQAAGLIGKSETFDPFASEDNFLLAAFIFEDVGVTAYKGAAPLIDNKTYLDAAAGIMAVEAYHAGVVRSSLYDKDLGAAANKISKARDSLDGRSNDDQGVVRKAGRANLVPADKHAIAYGRTPDRVLNVVYLTPKKSRKGGFYPHGVNGALAVSGGK